MTHHLKQKAMCCKQRVCSDCSSELLRRASGRAPCPFCRHEPLEVQAAASESEDEQELLVARQARLAEDQQLAEVLQDIEHEGLASFAGRLPGKSWLAVANEGKMKALEAEVGRLRLLLGARSASSTSSSLVARSYRPGFKTVLCRYHQMGRCAKGASCTYAHGEAELQGSLRQPANYKTVLCEFHQRGSCRSGSQCTFAHGGSELRAPQGGASQAMQNWLAARSLCAQAGLGSSTARSMEGQTEIAAWRQRLLDAKAERRGFSFPAMGAADRKVIHMLCEELGIQHESCGEAAARHVRIIFDAGSDAPSDVHDFFQRFDLDLASDED